MSVEVLRRRQEFPQQGGRDGGREGGWDDFREKDDNVVKSKQSFTIGCNILVGVFKSCQIHTNKNLPKKINIGFRC